MDRAHVPALDEPATVDAPISIDVAHGPVNQLAAENQFQVRPDQALRRVRRLWQARDTTEGRKPDAARFELLRIEAVRGQ